MIPIIVSAVFYDLIEGKVLSAKILDLLENVCSVGFSSVLMFSAFVQIWDKWDGLALDYLIKWNDPFHNVFQKCYASIILLWTSSNLMYYKIYIVYSIHLPPRILLLCIFFNLLLLIKHIINYP